MTSPHGLVLNIQVLFIQQYTFVKIIFVSWDDDKLIFMSSLAYFFHDVFDDCQSTRPKTTELGFSNVSLLQDRQRIVMEQRYKINAINT